MTIHIYRGSRTLVRAVAALVLLGAGASLWATGVPARPQGNPWSRPSPSGGWAFEREAVELMVQSFNDSHPGIQVRGQHIPDASYGQHRVTCTFRCADGGTLHAQSDTRGASDQRSIYDALGVDPAPGGTRKMVVA